MEEHILEYIRNRMVGSGNAALLIGPQATQKLRNLYEGFSDIKHRALIEITQNEAQFWANFLRIIKGENASKSGIEREISVGLVGISLKDFGRNYHLFLPDVDKMFYRYDVQQKGLMGASLRRIWQKPETNLTIFGSITDENSESFKSTIGKYKYPFWINNWCPIRL